MLAHTVSPPTGGITTARRIEIFGYASTKVTSVCHELARELKEARREIKALRGNATAADVEGKQLVLLN